MKFKHINCTSFSLAAKIGNEVRNIQFTEGGNGAFFKNAFLITEDEAIIKAVKECGLFGTSIVEEEEKVAKEEKTAIDPVIYDEVTTVQMARDILVKNHEGKVSNLANKTIILAFAAENNISFPNLPE